MLVLVFKIKIEEKKMSAVRDFLFKRFPAPARGCPIYGDELAPKEGEAPPSRICIMILPDSEARIPRSPRNPELQCRWELVDWTNRLLKSDQALPASHKSYDRFIYIYSLHLNDFISKHPEFSQVQVLADYTVTPICNKSGPFAGILRSRALVMPPILQTIKSANSYPTLKTLILNHNYLSDDQGVQIVKALTGNTTIRSLDLSFNKLGDRAGCALSELLESNTSLTELDLSGNPFFTSGTIANLASVLLSNTTVTRLALYHLSLCTETTADSHRLTAERDRLTADWRRLQEFVNRNIVLANWEKFIAHVQVPQLRNSYLVKRAFAEIPEDRKEALKTMYRDRYGDLPADIFADWSRFVDALTQSGVIFDVMGVIAKGLPVVGAASSSCDIESDPYSEISGIPGRDAIE